MGCPPVDIWGISGRYLWDILGIKLIYNGDFWGINWGYLGDIWAISWGYLQNYVFSRLKRIKFDRNILFPGSRSSEMGLSKLTISTLKACAPILENHKKVFFSHYQFYYQI